LGGQISRGGVIGAGSAVVLAALSAGIPGKPDAIGGPICKTQSIPVERKGLWGSMESKYRGSRLLAVAVAVALFGVAAPAKADADPGVTAFPGLEIHQGSTVCTLGFVELSLRIALTTGQCDGGSVVTDGHGKTLGTVLTARRAAEAPASEGSAPNPNVEYEVVGLAEDVTATDTLPTGRQLLSKPGVLAQPAQAACHFGIASGETCGRVSSVNDDRLVITGMPADQRDIGGPVYQLADDNHAVIVGLLEDVSNSTVTAESWPAAMQQLFMDTRSPGQPHIRVAARR
jgi:hypothetical protein